MQRHADLDIGRFMGKPHKLLPLLGKNDPVFLADAIASHASREEEEKGEAILRNIVDKAANSHSAALNKPEGKRPGPRKKSAINSTVEKIRRLYTTIRSSLGISQEECPDTRLLYLVLAVIKEFNHLCGEGIFLKKSERATIHCARLDTKLNDVAEAVVELKPMIADLDDCLNVAEETSWKRFVSPICEASLESKTLNDAECYQGLHVELGPMLDIFGRVSSKSIQRVIGKPKESIQATTNSEKGREKQQRHLIKSKNTLFSRDLDTDVSRPDVLKTAWVQLQRIRIIVKDALYVKNSPKIERLYELLRELNFYPSDSLGMRPIANLETVFLEAIKRQGRSPFLPTRPEEFTVDPSNLD